MTKEITDPERLLVLAEMSDSAERYEDMAQVSLMWGVVFTC